MDMPNEIRINADLNVDWSGEGVKYTRSDNHVVIPLDMLEDSGCGDTGKMGWWISPENREKLER